MFINKKKYKKEIDIFKHQINHLMGEIAGFKQALQTLGLEIYVDHDFRDDGVIVFHVEQRITKKCLDSASLGSQAVIEHILNSITHRLAEGISKEVKALMKRGR